MDMIKTRSALMFVLIRNKDEEQYYHTCRVAFQFNDDYFGVVAALHDVIEDGIATKDDLKQFELDEQQTEAINLLTRNKNIPYIKYIEQIKNNKIAVAVKIADLTDNIRRCAESIPDHLSLLKRYVNAYEKLIH